MADVGAIPPRSDALKSRYRGWRRGDAGFADRFRKPIVAATLAFGDVVAAIAAISLSRALIGITDAQPPDPKHLLIAFLILTFLCVGLYTGCGPSPYERFRLRTISIVAFVAIGRFGCPGRLWPEQSKIGAVARASALPWIEADRVHRDVS